MQKRIRWAILISVSFLLVFGIIFSSLIFQEGNPIPLVVGIWKISHGGEAITQISDRPVKFLIPNDNRESTKYPLLLPGAAHEVYVEKKSMDG